MDRLTERRKQTSAGFLLVAGAAALWGTDGLFRYFLAEGFPAAAIVFVEHLILVVITLPLVWRARRAVRSFTARDWLALVFVGAGASAAATVLLTQAFVYGNPTTPLLLQKLQPLFAIAGARLLLGERLLPRYGLYFVSAIAGAYLISFPEPTNVSVDAVAPAVLSISAAALWGFGTVMGRHLTGKVEFRELTALRFAVGLPATVVILVIFSAFSVLGTIDATAGGALLMLAVIPGLAALLLYYRGLRDTPASAATLAELAFPVSAVTINYLAFGTTLVTTQWLGLAILSTTIIAMGLASSRGTRAVGIELPRGEGEAPALQEA